jgi:hypothetical protein
VGRSAWLTIRFELHLGGQFFEGLEGVHDQIIEYLFCFYKVAMGQKWKWKLGGLMDYAERHRNAVNR